MDRSVVRFLHSRSLKSSLGARSAVCYHDDTVGVVVEINGKVGRFALVDPGENCLTGSASDWVSKEDRLGSAYKYESPIP